MIVVDASVWVSWLRGVLHPAYRRAILDHGCASPPHVDFEVGSALIRQERRGILQEGAAMSLINLFNRLTLERVHQPIDAVRAVSLLDNATYADAWYLALAERLGCPILTLDAGMRTAAKISGIELIEAADL